MQIICIIIVIFIILSLFTVYLKQQNKIKLFGGNEFQDRELITNQSEVFKSIILENKIDTVEKINEIIPKLNETVNNVNEKIDYIKNSAQEFPEVIENFNSIPPNISKIIKQITTISTNPITIIEKVLISVDGVRILIKSPFRKIRSLVSFSKKPLLEQNVDLIVCGYEKLIYNDIVVSSLNIFSSLIKSMEIIEKRVNDVVELDITQNYKNIYNDFIKNLSIEQLRFNLTNLINSENKEEIKDNIKILLSAFSNTIQSVEEMFKNYLEILNRITEKLKGK